jgi:hypothetical protein
MRPDVGGTPDPSPLALLTELANDARNQLPVPSPEELGDKWEVLSTRIAAQKARRRTIVRLSVAGVLATAVVAAWVLPLTGRLPGNATTRTALSYQVEGGIVVDGGYLRESGSDTVRMRFAEGTEFVLSPGTRARLRSVTSSGARIAIEHGTASFQVTPRREALWQVDVGPFLVTVKGTMFTVSWDAVGERFDLRLRHGEVSVTGPVSTGEISVKANQRLVIDLPKKETVITEEDDGASSAGLGSPWSDSADLVKGPASERPSPSAARPTGQRTVAAKSGAGRGWGEAVAAGQWDRVLTEVDRAGVKQTLAHASSEDLLALADAARYRRRTGLARAALLAERDRFPGSPSALDAAFLLGRLEESRHGERQGEMAEAVRWYDTYLSGAPSGTYASEALGRKIIATKGLRGAAAAESLAREYLRRFPAGPYAGAARELLLHP